MTRHEAWTVTRESSLRKIDPAEWSHVACGRGLYVSYPWLLAIEADDENADATTYLLVRQNGVLRAALPVYRRYRPDHDDFYDPIVQFLPPKAAAHHANSANNSWYPLVLGGTIAAYWNDLLFDDQTPEHVQLQALNLLMSEFERERGDASAALMYLMPQAAQQVLDHLRSRAHRLFVGAQTTIDVTWKTMDDYVLSLPSRRTVVRKEIRQFAAWEARKTSTSLRSCHEQLSPLIANLQRKYGHDLDEEIIARQLRGQAAQLDKVSKVFTCELGGRIVAFSLLYQWEGELYLRSIGFDYHAVDRATSAYFNLAFYEPIRYAIDHDIHRLHLGMGTYPAKMARGARLTPSWSIVLLSNAVQADEVQALAEFERIGVLRWQDKHQVKLPPADVG